MVAITEVDMSSFEDCLAKGRLSANVFAEDAFLSILRKSQDELRRSAAAFDSGRFSDTAEQAYFALLHACQAAVQSAGYRHTNFFSLLAAIEHLLVEAGVIADEAVDVLKASKETYELADSGGVVSERDARALLDWAQDIVPEIAGHLGVSDRDDDQNIER